MKLRDMSKIRRRKPTLDETACLSIRDAATMFNMGENRFRKVFFQTDLCDTIPHVRTASKGGLYLSLRHVVEAAFPGMDSTKQAVIIFEYLKEREARRKAAHAQRVATTLRKRSNG